MFNVDGDVDLIRYSSHIDMVDVHAIAGLLKLYLRELPNPVLTKNLHGEFLNIINLDDRNDRVTTLAHLLSQLPRANYTLLETLISHLLSIVQSSSTNKMSVMNVGIVFAPTLGVPAIVFVLMVAEFGDVFCWSDQNGEAATKMKDRIRELQDKKDGNIEIQVPVDDNDTASLDEGRDENEPVPTAGSVVPDISATHVSILGEEGLLSDSDIQKLMS
ncbi:hypothetical protein HDU99_003093 [Rhizoclosmatium hyalinum]|nr:hypothetical protein HDU99_003093 [Rhizoclosmatium hyalinum]